MNRVSGEMSFLDHLEELRWRIIWSLAALILACGFGIWAVNRFHILSIIIKPVAPYLPDGKLTNLTVGGTFFAVVKLGVITGIVLASPVILWQIWAFVAPALYGREKKILIPALFGGLVLFLTGSLIAYEFVVPKMFQVLFTEFHVEEIESRITFDSYIGFLLQIVLGMGLAFELPLLIIGLAWFGVIESAQLRWFRRYAIVLSLVLGAVLSPGGDPISMSLLAVPLILLYEIGVLGAALIGRRRRKQAATTAGIILLLCCFGARAEAQVPTQRDSAAIADSLRALQEEEGVRPGQALDTATARRMGLPTGPSRSFAPADSVVNALLQREGYRSTRYRADSARLYVPEERMILRGQALTEWQGTLLEADTIRYDQAECILDAEGEPHLFDKQQVLVGERIRYNSCTQRGSVQDALTNFTEGGTVWFLRGNVAQDSSSKRIYAGSSDMTSCDLPVPHYFFSAGQVKWLSQNVLVARPVILHIADVPVLWLPFIFQDMRPGRHSGILVPQFGINDLIRPSRSYNRQISNIGYYWAINDYLDAAFRLDWYSNRYTQYGIATQYRWIDRFMSGGLAWNNQRQVDGRSSMSVRWDHRQQFDAATSLNFNVDYISDRFVLDQNAIDPLQNTQQVSSAANFSKRYGWGTLNLGGNRRQNLSTGEIQYLLPTFTLSPVPLDIGERITWSPSLSLTNSSTSNAPLPPLVRVLPSGLLDSIAQTGSNRVTSLNFDTPFRFGSFNWTNSVRVIDEFSNARDSVGFTVPDQTTLDPLDSLTVNQVFSGRFQTGIDWDTGINLPILFRGSWKLQPTLGIANATSAAPFAIRNRNTNGDFVIQGKRFRFGLSSAPTVFAFFPGIGPLSGIRHSFSPSVSYNYAPAAQISETFARAIALPGQELELRSLPMQTMTVSLSQVFEGKLRPAKGDTLSTAARKLRLLSINTSGVSYDFEQAKQPGRTGWITETINNSFLSDLLPGFSLNVSHDLWEGVAGSDTARFDPFLQSVSANFSLSGRTLCAIASIIRLCPRPAVGADRTGRIFSPDANRRGPGTFAPAGQVPLGQNRPFTANFSYSLSRTRPSATNPSPNNPQNLNFSTAFSPTPFWSLSWDSQYNITDAKFESQRIRLSRELHEWRAEFSFFRNANGNTAFYFTVFLTDLPDLKFDYDQTTFEN